MKNSMKSLSMTVAVMFLSVTLFAQLNISSLEKKMMKNTAPGNGAGNSPLNADAATPITVFPFMETFESGVWSPHTEPFHGLEANATIAAGEGNASNFAALLEGNSWASFYHTEDCEQAIANNKPIHNASISMTIVPSGVTDPLLLKFDYDLFYSFADYYSAFRVTVNGNPISDQGGTSCYKSSLPEGEGWKTLTFDLSPYQNDASFDLQIDFIGKYYRNYYQGGDAMVIDNLKVYYNTPPTIPISNWPIIFGVLLIALFIVFQYRRKITA